MAETVTRVDEVKAFRTRSGNTRFVLRDADGNEYTTFREEVARSALAYEGRRARLSYHEEQRGQYRNVYLDAVDAPDASGQSADEHADAVEEVAWKTAVDAAPWLVGGEPEEPVSPEELFELLQPFKERVARDIRSATDGD
jgi:hypothetical protein